jgi:hypothetical protein
VPGVPYMLNAFLRSRERFMASSRVSITISLREMLAGFRDPIVEPMPRGSTVGVPLLEGAAVDVLDCSCVCAWWNEAKLTRSLDTTALLLFFGSMLRPEPSDRRKHGLGFCAEISQEVSMIGLFILAGVEGRLEVTPSSERMCVRVCV